MAWYDFITDIGSGIKEGASNLGDYLGFGDSSNTVTMDGLEFGGRAGEQTSPGQYNLGGGLTYAPPVTMDGLEFGGRAGQATPSGYQLGGGLTTADTSYLGGAPAVTPAVKTDADKGGTGLMGTASKALGWVTDLAKENPLLAVLALTQGINALRGPQTSTAEKTMLAQQKIPNQIAQQQMQQFQSGQLNAYDQSQLDKYYRDAKSQIDDYWSRAGAPDSSGHVEMLNQLQQDMVSKAEQLRQQYLANALSASGTAGNISGALAQIQASGDAQAQNALNNLLYAAAQGGRRTP